MKKLLYISIPFLLVALVMLYFQVVRGASEAQFPETGDVDTAFGASNWSNSDRIVTSNDSYASIFLNDTLSVYLKGSNFGFAIPDGATINGIELGIEGYSNSPNAYKDARVRIVKGGAIGSTDKANSAFYPTSEATVTYGSSSDLWGETWTSTNINASSFGAVLSVQCPDLDCLDLSKLVLIDSFQITVYYTEASASTETTTFQIRNGSIRQTGGSVKIGK